MTHGQTTRPRRWWRIVSILAGLLAGLLILLAAVCAVVWRPLAIEIMRHQALAEFEHDYSTATDLHIVQADADWVYSFGGSRSLPELRRMLTDSSLDRRGQALAAHLVEFIESGEHLSWFEMELDPKYKMQLGWPREALTRYICQRDQHLRRIEAKP